MSEHPTWLQEDDGFCRYCKPWHWPQKPMAIHLSKERSPFFHRLEPFAIGGRIVKRVCEVWMPTPGFIYVIALSERGDLEQSLRCPCGAPQLSQRVLWTTDPPPLVFSGMGGKQVLTIVCTRDDAPKTDTHDPVLTLSKKVPAPKREPWMSDDDYARFQQGHML